MKSVEKALGSVLNFLKDYFVVPILLLLIIVVGGTVILFLYAAYCIDLWMKERQRIKQLLKTPVEPLLPEIHFARCSGCGQWFKQYEHMPVMKTIVSKHLKKDETEEVTPLYEVYGMQFLCKGCRNKESTFPEAVDNYIKSRENEV